MTLETDYLVVGAGASGMAFADALAARSDADIVLVDRKHRPGGHWNDDYPFVRLHQPSAYYGVDSLPLGEDRIDDSGPNQGFYERASAAEICEYYARALDRLVASGRVRFFAMTEYAGEADGEHAIRSLLTGDTRSVRVRRRLVDATYIATSIPSLHKPSFSADPGVRVIPPNDLVRPGAPASSFTIIGAGKTSMDTCCWLVDRGVDLDAIRWIRPRDPWIIDRQWMQPLTQIGSMTEWLARQNEAAAEATDVADLMRRLEDKDVHRRLDPNVEPSVYRGAILSRAEQSTIARVTSVVRMGRVLHIGADAVTLEEGSLPVRADEVFIDCSASGTRRPPTRPIFQPGRITVQRVQTGVDPFSPALIGVVEACDRTDEQRNDLCPPNPLKEDPYGVAEGMLVTLRARVAWMADPQVRDWQLASRLTPFRGAAPHMTDEARESLKRLLVSTMPAIENLQRILA